jgi:hypothetical protein
MTSDNHDQAEPVDGAELLDDMAATITRYVILPSTSALTAVVLWSPQRMPYRPGTVRPGW